MSAASLAVTSNQALLVLLEGLPRLADAIPAALEEVMGLGLELSVAGVA
jgi:hypothetical protein